MKTLKLLGAFFLAFFVILGIGWCGGVEFVRGPNLAFAISIALFVGGMAAGAVASILNES